MELDVKHSALICPLIYVISRLYENSTNLSVNPCSFTAPNSMWLENKIVKQQTVQLHYTDQSRCETTYLHLYNDVLSSVTG